MKVHSAGQKGERHEIEGVATVPFLLARNEDQEDDDDDSSLNPGTSVSGSVSDDQFENVSDKVRIYRKKFQRKTY